MGDENAELESNGSYVYANRYTDRNGDAPGEDEPKLMGEYDSANNCAAAIAHFLLSV